VLCHHVPNLAEARALAFAASCSRFLDAALVSRDVSRFCEMAAISSTAAVKVASFVFDGLLNPVILRTYCSAAARVSSSVTGGSKLNSVLMFLHIRVKPLSQPCHGLPKISQLGNFGYRRYMAPRFFY